MFCSDSQPSNLDCGFYRLRHDQRWDLGLQQPLNSPEHVRSEGVELRRFGLAWCSLSLIGRSRDSIPRQAQGRQGSSCLLDVAYHLVHSYDHRSVPSTTEREGLPSGEWSRILDSQAGKRGGRPPRPLHVWRSHDPSTKRHSPSYPLPRHPLPPFHLDMPYGAS